ncbi:MAG: DUF3048 domain-containing protein [Acidimicrobiales bacterium]|nr:DUF3048 domain-containing protein [Acidimicrobiales bacterium]
MGRLAGAARALLGNRWGRAALALVAVVAVVVAVVVLRGGDSDEPVAGTTTTTTTDSTPTVPDPPSDLRFLPEDADAPGSPAPLTGLPASDDALARPAIAAKVDNLDTASETARPQAGLAHADVVVEQLVEGGITRFVAVLHSTGVDDVGPIRSARTTDVDLVPMFGRALFAYSGGNGGVLAQVRGSGRFVDASGGEPVYHRVSDRRAPHNLFLRPAQQWARPGDATSPPALGPFSTAIADGDEVEGVTLSWSGAAAVGVSWSWEAGAARWVRYQNDSVHLTSEGYAIGPRNVVLMFVEYRPSVVDARSPEAVTVGSGDAWVLRDGRLIGARWERADAGSPLTLVDDEGAAVTLTPGRTWIELLAPGSVVVDG